ncbi:MAG: metalloregulator ArsR/SmtB family transcription factor [Actinomycetota bacterium]|nr:metalloregulator ArsR/SmtB family transcription factor [Actinomycetota bacterium]
MNVDSDVETPGALRALAEPLRWRITQLLADDELCVCHLVEELAVAQPLVSHHLRILRDAGLVDTARYRYWTYYRLRPEALAPLRDRLDRLVRRPSAPDERRRPCC